MALKGIGYKSDTLDNVNRIKSLNPKWWYNWNQIRLMGTLDQIPDAEWIPMLYSDTNSGSHPRLDNFTADIKAEKAALAAAGKPPLSAMLGFNEPDHPDQADMLPIEALNNWKPLMDNGFNVKKVSPVPTGFPSIWLDRFMDAQKALDQGQVSTARDFEVHYVALHIYGGINSTGWLQKCDDAFARYNKPIWVTETCVHDTAATTVAENRYSRAQVEQFMREIWAGAQTRPHIQRIAWHTRDITDPVGTSGSLFNSNGTLTSTGVVWRDLDKVS